MINFFIKVLRKKKLELKILVRKIRQFHPFSYFIARFSKYDISYKKISTDRITKINVFGASEKKYNYELLDENINAINLNFSDIFSNSMEFYTNKNGKKLSIVKYNVISDENYLFDLKRMVSKCVVEKSSFIIVLIKHKDVMFSRRKLSKILGRLGANYIIYSDISNDIGSFKIKTYRYDHPTYVLNNLENLSNSVGITSCIHIGVNLNNICENYRYYIVLDNKKNKLNYFDYRRKDVFANYRKRYNFLKEKSKLILLEDVFKIIGEEIPDNVKKISKKEIGKICSRFNEVSKDDVLFLLEPYRYSNDKDTASDSLRIYQAKLAKYKGAAYIFSYLPIKNSMSKVINDVRESHIKICSFLHQQNEVKTIVVTGSVGKTTTKDMLGLTLSKKYNVLKSIKNGNLQIKIGSNIQKISNDTEVYIQEIGGGRPGGASRHSRMVNPNATIVTNIGTAHLGNFESQEDLMRNKLGINDGLKNGGTYFQNMDDPLLSKEKISNINVIKYSIENRNADYYASNILNTFLGFEFYINDKKNKKKYHTYINVPGRHNILNAVLCFAVGSKFGVAPNDILDAISMYKTDGIRQNYINVGNNKILFDCYNASLDSVKTFLETLNSLDHDARKICILGDLTGIGDESDNIHKEIGYELSKYKFDEIILFGDSIKISSNILKELKIKHYYFPLKQWKKTFVFFKDIIKKDDIIGLKGSSKLKLEYFIDKVYGTGYNAINLTDEGEFQSVPLVSYKYYIFDDYSMLKSYRGKYKNVHILNSVLLKKCRGVLPKVFKNNIYINNLYMSSNNEYVGSYSFANCVNLKFADLKNVKFIDSYAFSGCIRLNKVVLKKNLIEIKDYAFRNCRELNDIYLPDSLVRIGESAFEGCEKIVIHCKKNSIAYKYAIDNKIKVVCD